MQTELPSIFDVVPGGDKCEAYIVPGTACILRLAANKYFPEKNGVRDSDLEKAIDDEFRGRSFTASLAHEVGRFVIERAT